MQDKIRDIIFNIPEYDAGKNDTELEDIYDGGNAFTIEWDLQLDGGTSRVQTIGSCECDHKPDEPEEVIIPDIIDCGTCRTSELEYTLTLECGDSDREAGTIIECGTNTIEDFNTYDNGNSKIVAYALEFDGGTSINTSFDELNCGNSYND